ncbi:MAG: hypothetical protein QOE34_2104 [Verrucomicrobiota bacterium]|jgi:hypothetical protein
MLTDISSATLRKMVTLSERKEALLSQIQELDRQMSALQQPAGEAESQPSRAKSFERSGAKPRTARGALKARIVGALRTAGPGGLTIRELSKKLKVKPANLYVWFNGTGRKTKGVKKIGPAKYRFRA